jgi:hypothetical protein
MSSNVNLSKTILLTLPFCLKLLETDKTDVAIFISNLPTTMNMIYGYLDYHHFKKLFIKMGVGLIAAVGIRA